MDTQKPDLNFEYRYGFSMPQNYTFKARKGLDSDVVRQISALKKEPKWMLDFRLKSYDLFLKRPMPIWGADLSRINFDEIYYYIKPIKDQTNSWNDLPKEIKETYDRIGVPEAEKKYLAGVSAQYECLTGDALVFINSGVKKIKDIEPNTYVYSLNEKTKLLEKRRVKSLLHKGKRQVYKVNVAGRELKCTLKHPFLALRYTKQQEKQRGRFHVEWRYLEDLKEGDYVAIVKQIPQNGSSYKLPEISFQTTFEGGNQSKRFKVTSMKMYSRKTKHLKIPLYSTEELMWLLGLILGDGYISNGQKNYQILSLAIPENEREIRSKIIKCIKSLFNYNLRQKQEKYRIRVHSTPIVRFIKNISFDGNAHTKKLVEWVFSLPKSEKLALLAGYIDSDGYVRTGKKNSDVFITSVNRNLLQSFQMLALSSDLHVGGIFPFYYFADVKNKKNRKRAYRLQITGDLFPLSPYSLKVKSHFVSRKYYHRYGSHHKSSLDKYVSDMIGFSSIKSISRSSVEDVFDIEVEETHNFVANGIIVHNSEVVYESVNRELNKLGVIFCDMDTALKKHPDIVKKYFGTLIPPHDNKFAALNSAVWSGGSFVYVPKNVKVNLPLQAYFRINAEKFGQFERTIIIADEGSDVHYVEGCTAPIYTTDSLHSAVVEIFVKKNAKVRYTTVQNWSKNVYNLVTKRAQAEEDAAMEWVDCNLGSQVTMKYPSVYLTGKRARGEVLSIAFAGRGQHQDAGAKMFHFAPNTTSRIVSKSISKDGGRTSYRGLVQVMPGAKGSSVYVSCDALLLDKESRSDTYPSMRIKESDVAVQHEATVEKLGEKKLLYLMSRGINKSDAEGLLVNGFIKPVTKEIPLEYSIELNRLINLEMAGSVG